MRSFMFRACLTGVVASLAACSQPLRRPAPAPVVEQSKPQQAAPVPAAAFQLFRSYDGAHHGFGDRGVRAVSAAETTMSVFAARQGATGPLTIVVVNKSDRSLRTKLALKHFPHRTKATAYGYAGGPITPRPVSVAAGGLTTTYPARSATLLVVRPR